MNVRFLLLLIVVCSAVTLSACSSCSPAPPAANNSVAQNANTSALPPGVTPATDGRPVSRVVPQDGPNPVVAMDGNDAGPMRITFKQGENSSAVAGKVGNSERRDHVVSASNGQTMTVTLTSTDNNATFWIQHHQGKELDRAKPTDNARSWTGKVDVSGDYFVIVKGTKGAADYQLNVTLK